MKPAEQSELVSYLRPNIILLGTCRNFGRALTKRLRAY